MNFSELPFNTEQMIAGLSLWVETESPSYDSDAVNRVIDLAAYDLASIGAAAVSYTHLTLPTIYSV